jgi:hypothetical protein
MSDQSGEIFGQYDDEGILPDLESPLGVDKHGTTADEEAEGPLLEDRLRAELPEDEIPPVDPGDDRSSEEAAMHLLDPQ